MAPRDDEGRGKLRKAAGRRKQPLIRGCPNGATRHGEAVASRKGQLPGELKHLSTRRKGKQTSDPASSGERKRASPNPGTCAGGL